MQLPEERITALTAAFGAGDPPGVVVEHDDPECGDCSFLTRHLLGRKWTEVEDEPLSQMSSDLPLLTEAARRYYLPAFIRFAYRHSDWNLEYILMNIEPEQLGPLPEPSRRALIDFLRWISSEPEQRLEREEAEKLVALWEATGS